jgi:hypothetical protein
MSCVVAIVFCSCAIFSAEDAAFCFSAFAGAAALAALALFDVPLYALPALACEVLVCAGSADDDGMAGVETFLSPGARPEDIVVELEEVGADIDTAEGAGWVDIRRDRTSGFLQ